ncbi:hypothetical protein ABRG53_1177 [Pseudanabaena sp. ABRG5-3]|nr:hypothetical protein ABRG53_1177 [Pseudanabaena sp. ABRG5-3]
MYQIDWGVKDINSSWNKLFPILLPMRKRNLAIATFISFQIATLSVPNQIFAENKSLSLQEDTPEEVLRAEIYTDARSPIDGKQLSAAEYTELMEKMRSLDNIPPEDLVSPKVREVIDLLKLRKFLRQFIPFIP